MDETTSPGRFGAPGIGRRAPGFGRRTPGFGPSDRGWFIGGGIALIWTFPTLLSLWELPDLWASIAGTVVEVLFAAVFLVSVPVIRRTRQRFARLLPAGILFGLSLLLLPLIGDGVRWTWTFVGVAIAVSRTGRSVVFPLVGALSLGAFVVGAPEDSFLSALNAAVILSVSFMMFSFVENIVTLEKLRTAQDQVAELAAERERSRVARDVHDILGHSLTVITVKAELAGRLMDAGSPAARNEVAQIEQLSRGALADVRATVHGYRGVSISGELAAARAALESAGVAAELPGSTDQVPSDRRELAGWVVREAVTNVVRHAEASVCRVSLDARSVEVADDGRGPSGASSGSGLTGLRERVETAGGRMSVGRSDLGGFRVRVTW
ncbi:sensor histidine kinase [Microbacterium sp. T32]|uniref:sensor histidine kinase n=1 Tax=Microbacterium sp. T32 TaxID=1776083 RepID=UPI0009EE59A5|nr:histidine kinase [Microbacterium sp. T32]